jgi:transcriptional regulator with XRE-family HTH domain
VGDLKKTIGNKLKEAREEAGLNQNEVAELLQLRRGSSYGHIEAGRNWIQVEHLLKLCDFYHKPITFFLGGKADLSSDESELLQLYRTLPPGPARRYAIDDLRAWVKFQEKNE